MPPLTGLVDIYGQEITLAAKIACQEINESGGVLGKPLELIIEDDGSLPESAVSAAEKLVQQHDCVAIIGNLLSNSRIAVAYRVAEPFKIPYLNFSFYEGSISSRYFFHFAALPNQQIDKMIPYMHKQYGPKMFFAGNNYEWPRGSIAAAIQALDKLNGEVVGEEYYPLGVSQNDIDRLLDNIAESGADVFVPYFAGTDQIKLLTAYTNRGLKKHIAVVMGHYDETMVSHLSSEVREGFYSSNTYFMTVDTQENQRYLDRLRSMPGITGIWPHGNGTLSNFGEGTYLCVKAFAKAANMANSIEPEALIGVLESISLSGPQGLVQMNPLTHHARVNTYLSRCQADGSFKIIERFGPIDPVMPQRYRFMQISSQAHLEEDIRLQARIIEQIGEAIFLVSAFEGTIIYSNPGAESMFGYSKKELNGKHFEELIVSFGEKLEQAAVDINAILYRKGIWKGDIKTVDKNGSNFWCSLSVSAFTHDKHGEVWMLVFNDITEGKQAEKALQEGETNLRTLFNAMTDVVFEMDYDGRYIKIAPTSLELMFKPREDLIGKTLHEVFPIPQADKFLEFIRKCLDENETATIEYPLVIDNKTKWFEGRGTPATKSTIIYIARDITERKKTEESLLASEKNYRNVVQDQTEFIMRFLPDGTRTFVNDSYCRAYNTTPEQMIGTSFFKEIPKPVLHRIEQKIASLTAENSIITDEHEFISPDGNKVWHTWTDRGIFDEKGKLMEIQAVGRDITERKQAEEEVRKLSIAIIQSPSVIAITDLNGDLEYVNPRFTELTGYTSEEAMGQSPRILKSGEHSDKMYKDMWETISSGKEWRGELLNKKKNGELYWEATSISPIFDRQGLKTNYIKFAEDITERKAAEIALVKSRESLAEAQRIAHVGNWESDLIENELFWSDEVYRIFGFKPQEFPATNELFLDHIHPDDLDRVNKTFSDSLVDKTPYSITYRIQLKNGNIKYVYGQGETFYDNNGKAVRSVGAVQDVTEQKKADEKIKSTREYANNLVKSSLDMIIAVDIKRKITEFNRSAEETFGYLRNDVLGKHINLLYANPKEGLKVHKQTILNGHHVQEILNKRKNGEIFPTLLSASILKDTNGIQIGVMGVSRDITESIEAEKKLKNYVSKIKGINEASHILTQSLDSKIVINRGIDIAKEMFETDSVTLFILEEDGKYLKPLASNGNYREQVMEFKLKIGEGLTGKVVQEKNAKIINRIDLTNIGKQIPGTPVEAESLMCAPLKIDHEVIGAILLSKLGEEEFWEDDLAFLVNLADLCAVAIQNSQLYEETEKANKVKDQFIANISHEIRTPLTAISGFTGLLKKSLGEKAQSEQQDFFTYIESSSERLLHTVDSILNVSQLEAGTIQLAPHTLYLAQITQSICHELHPSADEKGLEFTFLSSTEDDKIRLDQYSISQAIFNIIHNAIKYTNTGDVTVQLKRVRKRLVLTVSDTGIGISDEYRQRMFQPFSQESEGFTKDYQGIGLGLALTKRYLELNKVQIQVESKKGEGSTFILTFPKDNGDHCD